MAEGRGFNPSRLTLARKRRGLTKQKLGDRIGMDWRSVSAYEGGEYPPSYETLIKLESALEFPRTFFQGCDLDIPEPDAASFRAMTKMTASQRDMALGQGALALHLCKWIEKRFDLPQADLPDLSRDRTPEAAADSLRAHWGIGVLPVKNMVHLLEAKGVRVFSLAIDAREVDAFSMWKETTPFVFLNTGKSSEHSRYDAAHELGHLVLHRHGAPQGPEAERQANAFASAFLMPKSSVFAYGRSSPTLARLLELKKTWNVSVAALNYRLHVLSLTSDWQYRSLCVQISQSGYRMREPDGSPHENSQVFVKVLLSLREEGITRFQIANELCISVPELDQLMFGLVMITVDGGGRRVPVKESSDAGLRLVRENEEDMTP